MEETIYDEMRAIMKKFSNAKPVSGFEVSYFEKAQEILELYDEACACIDRYGYSDIETNKKLELILEQMKKIIE